MPAEGTCSSPFSKSLTAAAGPNDMHMCLTQLQPCLAKVSIAYSPRHSSSLSSKGRQSTARLERLSSSNTVCAQSSCCPRAAISKLRDDNAKLKEELLLENKFSVTPTSSNLSANIANLQDQSDIYTRKVAFDLLVLSCLCCSMCNSTISSG